MEDISAFTTKQHVRTLEINWILSTWQMLFSTVLVIKQEVRTNVPVYVCVFVLFLNLKQK